MYSDEHLEELRRNGVSGTSDESLQLLEALLITRAELAGARAQLARPEVAALVEALQEAEREKALADARDTLARLERG